MPIGLPRWRSHAYRVCQIQSAPTLSAVRKVLQGRAVRTPDVGSSYTYCYMPTGVPVGPT